MSSDDHTEAAFFEDGDQGGAGQSLLSVTFRYTENEFVSAFRLWIGPKIKLRGVVLSCVLVCFLAVLMLVAGTQIAVAIVTLLLSLATIGVFGGLWFIWPRRTFQNEPSFREEYHLDFLDSGIEVRAGDEKTHVAWRDYSGVRFDALTFVLLSRDGLFTALPRSAFDNDQAQARFLRLVRTRVVE